MKYVLFLIAVTLSLSWGCGHIMYILTHFRSVVHVLVDHSAGLMCCDTLVFRCTIGMCLGRCGTIIKSVPDSTWWLTAYGGYHDRVVSSRIISRGSDSLGDHAKKGFTPRQLSLVGVCGYFEVA